jgi:hypothetical protein
VAIATDAEAVLITGVYGAGKSSVVADIGAVLQTRGEHFGLLDVDWLGWFDCGGDEALHDQVLYSNVRRMCAAYLEVGVRRLALARSVKDQSQLDAIRAAVMVPMRVVRLEVDESLVEQRLSSDPTEERQLDDLKVAKEWLIAGYGVGLEELRLPGDRPIRETSELICSWLGWI